MSARVALVTGGTGGIGTAIVRRLAKMGYRVATNYRNEEKTKAWHDKLKGEGIDVLTVKGDVSDPESCKAMVQEVEQKLGPIDVLINNAGITRDTTFHKMSYQQWTDVVNTNLNACFNVTRPVIEGMRNRKWGRIVQISSINGQKGQYGQANYAAAKAGVIGLAKSLAVEGARKGVRVNAIAPMAATAMTRDVFDERLTAALTPEGVSAVALALVHRSCPLTGEVVETGGGWASVLRWERSAGARLERPDPAAVDWAAVTSFHDRSDHPSSTADSLAGPMKERTSCPRT